MKTLALALIFAASMAAPALAQDPGGDELVVTAANAEETRDALRIREAIAYANPIPRGAPNSDYPLVAWCEARVLGHVALGESLNTTDELDLDLIRLGRLEASNFRAALEVGRARQTPQTLEAARAAAAAATVPWAVIMEQELAVRSQAFGFVHGLPGRCEHAARRVRENITTPPATPVEVGLEDEPAAAAGSTAAPSN